MAKLIKKRTRVEKVHWQHSWTWKHIPGTGYCIESDENGRIADDRQSLYAWCMENEALRYDGLEAIAGAWWEEGEVLCDCGGRATIYSAWLNTCYRCGADYDGNGNRLAPRSQWGADTGESLSDILIGDREDW